MTSSSALVRVLASLGRAALAGVERVERAVADLGAGQLHARGDAVLVDEDLEAQLGRAQAAHGVGVGAVPPATTLSP